VLVLVVLLAAIKIRDLKATTTGAVAMAHSPPGAFANAMYDDNSSARPGGGTDTLYAEPAAGMNANTGYMDVQGGHGDHEEF